jgi:hypothetical protein
VEFVTAKCGDAEMVLGDVVAPYSAWRKRVAIHELSIDDLAECLINDLDLTGIKNSKVVQGHGSTRALAVFPA